LDYVKSALISINAVTVSYRRSTWIKYQKTVFVSDQIYQKIIRSMQCDCSNRISAGWKKKPLTRRRRNKTSYLSILRLPSFYLY
jgi:hypothetical protein